MKHYPGRVMIGGLAGFLICAAVGLAADWPQFQGPNRDGLSPETGLLHAFPAEGAKVLWTLPVGPGYGNAVIRAGKAYAMDRVEDKQDVLRCLDLDTGKELWNFTYDAPGALDHNGSRTIPAVDERYVFTVGPFGDFHCIDLNTHQAVWRKNLVKDFGGKMARWGVTQCPVFYKDWVIVAPQAPGAGVAAFEKATGKVVWQAPLTGQVGYGSPNVATLAGVDQVLMLSAGKDEDAGDAGQAVGLAADTGKILWSYGGIQCKVPIPFPIPVGPDKVFVTEGYRTGCAMLQLTKTGDAFSVKELFKLSGYASQIQQPILFQGNLYLDNNENGRQDGLLCLSPEGKPLWRTRDTKGLPKFDRGGFLVADGVIYVVDASGTLRVVEATPSGYKEQGSAKLLEGREIWAPPALSDGRLIIRDQKQMKCIDLRPGK